MSLDHWPTYETHFYCRNNVWFWMKFAWNMASDRVKNRTFWCTAQLKKEKKSRPAQRKDLYVCGWRKMRGGKSIRISISRISVEKEKKKQNTKWSGYLLIFPFLTPPDGASLQSFFVPFTEFPFCRLFLPFSFYSPNASFIILFPLLWAAGQYNIRKCSNSDPLFNILQNPPIVSVTLGGGTWGQP